MAKKKEDQALEAPVQSDEAREKVVAQSTAGDASAVGVARRVVSGEEEERIKNLENRGSTVPIVGGEPQSDFPANDTGNEPVGAQAQHASFTTNGSLPLNMVPTPSGPVPVSAFTSNIDDANRRVQKAVESADEHVLRSGFRKLSRAQIESMNPADLRAVASDRGYDLGENRGSRVTRQRFLTAQQGDEVIPEGDEPSPADGGEPST